MIKWMRWMAMKALHKDGRSVVIEHHKIRQTVMLLKNNIVDPCGHVISIRRAANKRWKRRIMGPPLVYLHHITVGTYLLVLYTYTRRPNHSARNGRHHSHVYFWTSNLVLPPTVFVESGKTSIIFGTALHRAVLHIFTFVKILIPGQSTRSSQVTQPKFAML